MIDLKDNSIIKKKDVYLKKEYVNTKDKTINFGFSYKIYDSNYVIFKADINQDRPNKI